MTLTAKDYKEFIKRHQDCKNKYCPSDVEFCKNQLKSLEIQNDK